MEHQFAQILACPMCKSSLKYDNDMLNCKKCRKSFMIRDDIPILLP